MLRSLGAEKGFQVLFAAFNRIEALAGLLGIWRSGSVAVLVDPLTVSEDLYLQLEGKGVRLALSLQYSTSARPRRSRGLESRTCL
ncbi:MAG: AMP-binding protein [Acidilobus sp.]